MTIASRPSRAINHLPHRIPSTLDRSNVLDRQYDETLGGHYYGTHYSAPPPAKRAHSRANESATRTSPLLARTSYVLIVHHGVGGSVVILTAVTSPHSHRKCPLP